MANDQTGNPWVLDTASAGTKLGAVVGSVAHITALQWSGYNSAADQCIVQDGYRGIDVFVFSGKADLSPVDINIGQQIRIRDFILKTLDSGKLTVYLK